MPNNIDKPLGGNNVFTRALQGLDKATGSLGHAIGSAVTGDGGASKASPGFQQGPDLNPNHPDYQRIRSVVMNSEAGSGDPTKTIAPAKPPAVSPRSGNSVVKTQPVRKPETPSLAGGAKAEPASAPAPGGDGITSQVSNWWGGLSPDTKKAVMAGGGIAAVLAAFYAMNRGKKKEEPESYAAMPQMQQLPYYPPPAYGGGMGAPLQLSLKQGNAKAKEKRAMTKSELIRHTANYLKNLDIPSSGSGKQASHSKNASKKSLKNSLAYEMCKQGSIISAINTVYRHKTAAEKLAILRGVVRGTLNHLRNKQAKSLGRSVHPSAKLAGPSAGLVPGAVKTQAPTSSAQRMSVR